MAKVLTRITGCLLIVVCFGCEHRSTTADKASGADEDPLVTRGKEVLTQCINAHGGMEQWKKFDGLEYVLINHGDSLYQITNLSDRRSYLKAREFEVGFDGKVAWAFPDNSKVPQNSPSFYYNLDFYFIAMPFVLADPSVIVTYSGNIKIDSVAYESLKITFDSGVGSSPEDAYYLLIDPTTHVLQILAYSVTFFNKEAGINTAKVYSDWETIQGVLMPKRMDNYAWNDGTIGDSKNHIRTFENIRFLEKISNEDRFNPPAGAFVEPLTR